MTIEERARERCATLIPHTTSVHNVNVLIDALREERRLALEEAAKLIENNTRYGCNDPDAYCCRANAIRKLMEA